MNIDKLQLLMLIAQMDEASQESIENATTQIRNVAASYGEEGTIALLLLACEMAPKQLEDE